MLLKLLVLVSFIPFSRTCFANCYCHDVHPVLLLTVFDVKHYTKPLNSRHLFCVCANLFLFSLNISFSGLASIRSANMVGLA